MILFFQQPVNLPFAAGELNVNFANNFHFSIFLVSLP